ncbi:MAG TPA: GGDEF domain-containing protein [Pyrinomonadaceae bacterium]|nr:GGDEF domain-containing protein [Pyrinomonadaceae bacterium]
MKLLERVGRLSKFTIITAGLLLVALLGVANYLSGPDVSFLIFYTAPVFLAAWYVGRGAGLLMCAACGLSWLLAAAGTSEHYASALTPYWNVAVRLGFMLILAHIASAFKKSLEHERELARKDYLTGAVNVRHFDELAAAEINRARRHEHPFTVAYMDVDDFKLVNDRHGHSAGDRLLRMVADTTRRNVRVVDVVARLGGDEFAVLMPETGAEAAEVVVRRVRRRLLEAARAEGWPVTFSIGVVTWDAPPDSVYEMLRAADAQMYAAKRHGKNAVRHKVSNPRANAA